MGGLGENQISPETIISINITANRIIVIIIIIEAALLFTLVELITTINKLLILGWDNRRDGQTSICLSNLCVVFIRLLCGCEHGLLLFKIFFSAFV